MHKLTCTPSRTRPAAASGHDLDLLLRFQAPPPPKNPNRTPLCLLPVVDVSGSMRGGKLAGVQRALQRLVQHLQPGDFLGLVTFDSDVQVPARLGELTQEWRTQVLHKISQLRPGSSTNLSGGLLEAVAQVGARPLPKGMRARVLALTDGLANAGPAQTPEELRALVKEKFTNVTLSAFGYGLDCDQTLLGDLAEAGAGSFAFIDSDDAVLTAFARELGGLLSTWASDVRVRLAPGAGAPVEERLGDLLHGAEVSTVLRVAVPAGREGTEVQVARIEVRWKDARGEERLEVVEPSVTFVRAAEADTTDAPEVARARDERTLRETQEQSEACARRGNFAGAQQLLEDAAALVRDPSLAAFARTQLASAYQSALYHDASGLRSSSYAALKHKRQLRPECVVAECFGVDVSDVEQELEASFKSQAKPSGSPRSKDKTH